jgi:two-component system chemotaxis response regulator CheB
MQPDLNKTTLITRVVVIGSSTGGPQALREIFETLPDDLSISVIVAQHMLSEFVPEFVNSLSKNIRMKIELGQQNTVLEPGVIYVAPGGSNTRAGIDSLGRRCLNVVPSTAILSPSVDILMASVATVYGIGCLGIILTGMGSDGLEGMRAIKAVGGKTVVQDKATSAVYGMAQSVNDEHLADLILPLSEISNEIISWSLAK